MDSVDKVQSEIMAEVEDIRTVMDALKAGKISKKEYMEKMKLFKSANRNMTRRIKNLS